MHESRTNIYTCMHIKAYTYKTRSVKIYPQISHQLSGLISRERYTCIYDLHVCIDTSVFTRVYIHIMVLFSCVQINIVGLNCRKRPANKFSAEFLPPQLCTIKIVRFLFRAVDIIFHIYVHINMYIYIYTRDVRFDIYVKIICIYICIYMHIYIYI